MIQTKQQATRAPLAVTEREFEELPETNARKVEVVDGVLRVSPEPTFTHEIVVMRLGSLLAAACPPGLEAGPGTDIKLREVPLHVRAPDVIVARTGFERMMGPDQVALAVEVVSPSTGTQDHVHKRDEYLAAGIPNYWVVDQDEHGLWMEVYAGEQRLEGRLGGRRLHPRQRVPGIVRGRVHMDHPFPVDIDLDALAHRP